MLDFRGVPAWKAATLQPQIRPKSRGELSKVILVGGATRMPAVLNFIRNMTGIEPLGYDEAGAGPSSTNGMQLGKPSRPSKLQKGVNPDEAVALGAAVQAGVLQGQIKGLMVMDQWQASLMRALAGMKLKSDPSTKEKLRAKFELEDEEGSNQDQEGQEDGDGDIDDREVEGGEIKRSEISKPKPKMNRALRRKRERQIEVKSSSPESDGHPSS